MLHAGRCSWVSRSCPARLQRPVCARPPHSCSSRPSLRPRLHQQLPPQPAAMPALAQLTAPQTRAMHRARELGRFDTTGIARALAAALQVPWPTTRWPLHVFTSGACTCLLLSSFCHLMGCCSFHNSQAWLPAPCAQHPGLCRTILSCCGQPCVPQPPCHLLCDSNTKALLHSCSVPGVLGAGS